MKKILSFFVVFLLLQWTAVAQTLSDKIKEQADKCASSLLTEDYETFAACTHKRVIAAMGGKENMIASLKKSLAQMKSQGIEFLEVSLDQPEKPKNIGTWLVTLVPQHLVLKIPNGRLLKDGHLLGISEDKGGNWTFVDISDISPEQLSQLFPELANKLSLPAKKRPTFQPDEKAPVQKPATPPTEQRPPANTTAPRLGPPVRIEPGIVLRKAAITRSGAPIQVWIYLPEKAKEKIPVVLIAPAGSNMLCGSNLGDSSRPEHLPYVRAGFAVVAYEIEGAVPENADVEEIVQGLQTFSAAGFGIVDAQIALDFAMSQVALIDGNRVLTAGHSSAATIALLVAANDPRIKGCIAYAPECDVGASLPKETKEALSRLVANFPRFLYASSPVNYVKSLRCPLFLFRADDDTVVADLSGFVAAVKKSNPQVTFVRVPSGEHYDSMIAEGIPAAIRWAKKLPGFDK